MNSFATGILTILLGWLRTLLTNLWRLLDSENGSSLMGFLSQNWKMIFAVVCVGGFVADRIIYFFRWRPDYVWRSKLARLRRQREGEPESRNTAYQKQQTVAAAPSEDAFDSAAYSGESDQGNEAVNEYPYGVPADETISYQPILQTESTSYAPYAPSASTITNAEYNALYADDGFAEPAFHGADFSSDHSAPYTNPSTMQDFAPAIDASVPSAYASYADAYSDSNVEPVFDEPTSSWAPVAPAAYGGQVFPPMDAYAQAYENPAYGIPDAFGAPVPEPADYLHAIQQPCTIPPAPEALHTTGPKAPIHPGLDLQTFQQNVGIGDSTFESNDEPTDGALLKPAVDFPDSTFVPFYQNTTQENGKRGKGVLSSFAKKARNLVTADDEKSQLTIRDLQSKVDIRSAFHPPVLPKNPSEGDEE